MDEESRGHVHDQDVGATEFLEAESSREQSADVRLVRQIWRMVQEDSSLAMQELNGMDVHENSGELNVNDEECETDMDEKPIDENFNDDKVEAYFDENSLEMQGDLNQEIIEESGEAAADHCEPERLQESELCGEEGRLAVGLSAPVRVSKAEVEKHELTHVPYRSWCPICVRARGRKMPHYRRKERHDEVGMRIPRISMDYFFMSKHDEEAKENPVLVVLNEETNERYARATGRKGIGTEGVMEWLVRDVSEELKSWGHAGGTGGHIILKCDGEKAMTAFRDAVARFHGGVVVPESPAKGESQSNGSVEGSGRIVREFVRVFKIQLEEKAGADIASTDVILQWAVRWAAMVCSRYLIGEDGKTGFERRRGRPCILVVVPFGEKVWYKEVREGKHRKHHLETEWKEGIWLGHSRNTNEALIGTREGVVRAYSIKRREPHERWDAALIKEIKGTPKQPDPSRAGFEIPTKINFDPEIREVPQLSQPKRKDIDIRRMRITPALLQRYGYTEGCEGCRYKRAGLADGRSHSERCRTRIYEAMGESEEGKRVRERDDERLNMRMEGVYEEMIGNDGKTVSEEALEAKGAQEDVEMTEGLKALLSLKLGDTIKVVEGPTSLEARRRGVDHEDEPAAWDDVTGEPLVRGEVLKARAVEESA